MSNSISDYLKEPIEDLQNLYMELYDLGATTPKELLDETIFYWCLEKRTQYQSPDILKNFDKYLTLLWSNSTTIISDEVYDIFFRILIQIGLSINTSEIKKKYYPHKPNDAKNLVKIYNHDVLFTPKLDGVSGILIFYKKKLVLTTKQREGKFRDISHRLKHFDCYPQLLNLHNRVKKGEAKWAENLILRGEIIVKLSHLREEDRFKARSYAVGHILMKDDGPASKYPISFVVFDVSLAFSDSSVINNHIDRLNLIKSEDLTTVSVIERKIDSETDNVTSVEYWGALKETFNSDYNLDGIVVSDPFGKVYFAVKFSTDEYLVTVTGIEWTYKSQSYVPIISFTPFERGQIFEKVSMSNFSKLYSNKAHIGAKIAVCILGESNITFVKTVEYNEDESKQFYNLPKDSKICPITNKLIKKTTSDVIDLTSFQLLLKYLNVVGVGKTNSKLIYDCLRDTRSIDGIISSLKGLRGNVSMTIFNKVVEILNCLDNDLDLSQVLAIVPDDTLIGEKTIREYLLANPLIGHRIQTNSLTPDNIEDDSRSVTGIGEKKRASIYNRIKKFISWGPTTLIRIDYTK